MPIKLLSLLFALLSLVSCVAPAPPSGFLKKREPTERDRTTLYQRSWKDPKVDFSHYKSAYIAPTNTEHIKISNTRLNERNLFVESYQDDIQESATHLQQTFEKAFAHSKNRSWEVLKRPNRKRHSLLVETALVELAPSRPTIEFISTVVRGFSLLNNPVTAVEVRVRDARSGKVIATYADRKVPPIAALDLAKIRFYKAQHNVMTRWGKQTVRWINGNEPNPLLEKSPVRLITW